MRKQLLRITAKERRVLFYALNDLRNTLLEEGKCVNVVNVLMLKRDRRKFCVIDKV